ncbi:hypothetical protein [Micromonospora sp. WMMB235]|uniref:hypothetical protein n=1 Tax=Micromonospora sp. WMMB235 TaxID=1172030 RepID=UPI0008D9CCDD|nr:hypothetical protein [Micromonospora sp. WMMB235]OHX04586.1 hypothetical protein BFV98_17115 [Micromonospora sp. WMMB235]
MQDIDTLRHEMLDRIYTEAGGSTHRYVELNGFAADIGIEVDVAYSLVKDCSMRGLVEDASTFGGPSAALTPAGIREVQARRRRRADPALRSAAARNSLLRWFYAQDLADVHMPLTNKFLESDESTFEGERFGSNEIERAAEFLAGRGLIKGVSASGVRGPLRAKITIEGQDCVERHGGNVSEYIRDQRGTAPSINTNIGTINSSGALAVGSTGVTQSVTVGADPAALAEFAKTLLAELAKLPLPATVAEQAHDALREVAEAGEDTSRASNAFQRFVGYLVDAGKPVVTAAFMIAAQHYGLPSA